VIDILSSHRVPHSFLAQDFQSGPHLFDLNRTGPAISIPDQMRRGYHAVLEGLGRSYIGSDKPLLVIGGGVAGLMAAMTAVEEGVETWVIEKERLLSTQASCSSRYVCPTQYDWPANYWRKGFYPHDGEPMPFSWERGLAADVVKDLVQDEVNKFLNANRGSLTILNSEFLDYRVVSVAGHWWVVPNLSVSSEANDLPDAFAMVLACAGFGKENTIAAPFKKCPPLTGDSVTDATATPQRPYTGFRFWEMDDYEEDVPLLGIRSGNMPKVIISGSGDGALQDFLRIVIRSGSLGEECISAGALYGAIEKSLSGGTRRKFEQELLTVEQKFRASVEIGFSIRDMKTRKQHSCAINADAHAEHLRVIKELIEDARAWGQITQTLNKVLKNLHTELMIRMVYPCSHLTPFYGLNRFLVLLIGKYVEEKYPEVQIFYPHTMVTNVVSTTEVSGEDHRCGRAEDCHDKDHQVFCTAAKCVDVPPACITDEHKFAGGPYNVVIVRHGILPASRKDLLGGR
jgi:hypothetical protein